MSHAASGPWLTRRGFLRSVGGLALAGATGVGYSLWEATSIQVRHRSVAIPNLPAPFVGKTLAVLADFHLGAWSSVDFIRSIATLTNALAPDLVALVGDFAHRGTLGDRQIPLCLEALDAIRAPLGRFAVPGNHDLFARGSVYREAIARTSLTDVTNAAARVDVDGASLWFAGVDDLWWGRPDQRTALGQIPAGAATILLAHNPDFAEENPDPRVGLVLSGHTHGGQIRIPGLREWLPSRYGDKYRIGLVQGPASQVYVTAGLGTSFVPMRFRCPPEIGLLTLHADGA